MFSVDSNGVVRIVEVRSRPQGWEDIPDELLDAICEYLPQRNEVLPMREVSKHWNSVVNSVLERRTLEHWTIWNPFDEHLQDISSFPFMYLGVRSLDGPRSADDEDLSSLFQNGDMNPFPNNSVHLLGNNLEGNLHIFLSTPGVYLTSLKLHIDDLAPLEFYRILQQTPNLRACTLTLCGNSTNLNGVAKEMELLENEELPPSPCPALAYLRICGFGTARDNPVLSPWLLKLFAAQLISLEIESTDIDKLPLNRPFQKLQRLKIVKSPLHFLKGGSTFRAPLQELCLSNSGPAVRFTMLLHFIHNFSDSLVNLYLDRRIHFKDDVEETIKFPLTSKLCHVFPKMNKLAIDTKKLLHYPGHFQQRFPNLNTLQLPYFSFESDYSERRENREEERKREAADFCRDAGFWIQFPKLKIIEVHPNLWNYGRDFIVLSRA